MTSVIVIMGRHGSSQVIHRSISEVNSADFWQNARKITAHLGLYSWMPQLMAEQMLQVQPRIAFQLEFATFCENLSLLGAG